MQISFFLAEVLQKYSWIWWNIDIVMLHTCISFISFRLATPFYDQRCSGEPLRIPFYQYLILANLSIPCRVTAKPLLCCWDIGSSSITQHSDHSLLWHLYHWKDLAYTFLTVSYSCNSAHSLLRYCRYTSELTGTVALIGRSIYISMSS